MKESWVLIIALVIAYVAFTIRLMIIETRVSDYLHSIGYKRELLFTSSKGRKEYAWKRINEDSIDIIPDRDVLDRTLNEIRHKYK